jgi:hypothetical protein
MAALEGEHCEPATRTPFLGALAASAAPPARS